jgi:WXG100 family type VII secretion target
MRRGPPALQGDAGAGLGEACSQAPRAHLSRFHDRACAGAYGVCKTAVNAFEPPEGTGIGSCPDSDEEGGTDVSTIGAEMGQLQHLGQSFVRESQTVAQLVSTIGGQVQSTWWKGPAADRFRASWESDFAPTMKRLEAALQEASQEISRRHDALMQAGT